MTRLAFAASAVALLFAAVSPAGVEVKLDDTAKVGVKPGDWSKPSKVTSAEELEKLVEDKATREKIAKAVDLKTHDLLVFCWQGSGGDKIECVVLESNPEQVVFSRERGLTKDLRTHTKLYAVRKVARWSTK